MTTLVRWNPMRDVMSLRNEMNRLFEQAFDEMPSSRWQPSTNWGLAVDVSENDEAFVITASAPGVNPDDLEITISDNILTIKGDLTKEFGPSSSGKTIIIASTEGNISIPGAEEKKIGLNIYRKK